MPNQEFILHAPTIDCNRVIFSWSGPTPGRRTAFWVEYPDLSEVRSSPGKLAEAYLPVCLALAALGEATIRLPARVSDGVLERWSDVIAAAGKKLYRKAAPVRFLADDVDPQYRARGARTALFFGGGTESLLTLARLMGRGVSPLLASFGGGNWAGSDPLDNTVKFEIDETVARELNLDRLHVRTNFREVFLQADWEPYLKPGVSLMNALLALPSYLSFLFPVCEQLDIGSLANGNEMMNFPDEFFCFSPVMTDRLERAAENLEYRSYLGEILKEEVCSELYRHHPRFARYQYSCWRNRNRRWCYRCQSCMEYFALLRLNGLDPEAVGMEEALVRANLHALIAAVAKSPEARRGEIWERLYLHPRLRQDPLLGAALRRIRAKASVYRLYVLLPGWVHAGYRFLRRAYHARLRRWCARAASLVDAFRFDCWIVHGREKSGGQPLDFVYAGMDRHKNYFLKMALGEFRERFLGRLWAWQIAARLEECGEPCDLVVYELGGWKSICFWKRALFRVPLWVRTEVRVPADEKALLADKRYDSVRRRIRKHRLSHEFSSDPAVLKRFYADMYVPYVLSRHGGAVYLTECSALERKLAGGELLLVLQDGQPVGGQLVEYSGGRARLSVIGLLRGDPEFLRMGASGALFYFSLLRFSERGCSSADFGYARAFLSDGALQNKLGLGARLLRDYHRESGTLTFQVLRRAPGVEAFFASNPFVTLCERGLEAVRFAALASDVTPKAIQAWVEAAHLDGVQGLTVYVFEDAPDSVLLPDLDPPFDRVRVRSVRRLQAPQAPARLPSLREVLRARKRESMPA